MIKHVQSVIEAMSSSSASGCASTLGDRAEWIYRWINSRSIVNEAFDQVLSDHSDLCDGVKSPSKCLVSVIQVTHHGNITRHRQTNEDRRVVILVQV